MLLSCATIFVALANRGNCSLCGEFVMELSCLQLQIVESRKNTRHMCVHCHFERKNGVDDHADCYDNYLRRKCPNAGGMSSGLSVIHFEIQSNYDSSLTNVVKLLLPVLYPLTLCALSRDCMYFQTLF